MLFDDIAEKIGMGLENKIREKILSDIPPPNAESTISRKGSSHTLIDNGILLNSISHTVEQTNDNSINVTIGVLDPEIAEYAAPNEHGVIWENRPNKGSDTGINTTGWFIPPRSFIRSTFDEEYENILKDIQQEIQDYVEKRLSK